MERISKGYQPRITPLTHEKAYVATRNADEQMTPTENGGWNVEAGVFETIRNYRQLNKIDYDDKRFLFIPIWHLFLDAFTAAVENGFIDRTNWKRAFRFSDDWLALGNDLLRAETAWLNERHRNAILATMLHGHPALSGFSTCQELGEFLIEKIDWQTSSQRLRLV